MLAAPNQVHTRSFGDDYFVVVTPSPEPRIHDIRHAYLDYLIDPLAIRNSAAFEKKKGLGDLAQGSPLLAEDYKNDFTRLAGMCMVRAVEARLDRGAGPAFVDESMKEGFILTAYFYEALGVYEKQEQAFRLYFQTMIDGIDVAKEDKRIARVEFVSQRAVKVVKVAPPKEPELSGPANWLPMLRSYMTAGICRWPKRLTACCCRKMPAGCCMPRLTTVWHELRRWKSNRKSPSSSLNEFLNSSPNPSSEPGATSTWRVSREPLRNLKRR